MSLKKMKGIHFKDTITYSALLCKKELKCFAERVLHERLGLCKTHCTCLAGYAYWPIHSFKPTFYVYFFELFPESIC